MINKTGSKEFVFRSKSNPNNSYVAILYTDGTTSCDCRGWTIKKSDKPRGCRHTKEVEANNPVNGTVPKEKTKPAVEPVAPTREDIEDIEPMCAGVMNEEDLERAWDDDRYIAEEKLDGARYILHLGKKTNRLFSRRKSTLDGLRIEKTGNVPHLRDLKHKLDGTIIDGEITIGHKSNDVSRVMGAHHERAVEVQEDIGYVTYKVWDIIKYKGESLRDKPLHYRYAVLLKVIKALKSKHIVTPARVATNKKKFFQDIIAAGGEGVIIKDLEGLYTDGARTAVWAKVKRESTWNTICTGFTVGKNAFADTFGSIKLSMYKDGKLTEVGQCSGMTLQIRRDVHADRNGYLGKVLEVTGQEFTAGGRIRHPRFKGWRLDVDPKTVRFEDEVKSI